MSFLDEPLDLKAKLDDVIATVNLLGPRLEKLEAFMAEHQAGAARRQQEIDSLRSENKRLKWLMERRASNR